ncbi:hypothetical protein [Pseudoalteromonas rubra]|uniref:hypothetical protein n=1 Tax=Pseudoalteromonas rubra TaxID=43658 RepID=UPI000F79AE96|nr:hypothetical protein [Pseudoalteromonas rubra]
MNPVSFLEKLRDQYVATENDDLLFTNKECTLDSTVYRLNCWKDFHGKDSIVVFELKEKGLLISTSACLGIRYTETQDALLLSERQLWDIGIP